MHQALVAAGIFRLVVLDGPVVAQLRRVGFESPVKLDLPGLGREDECSVDGLDGFAVGDSGLKNDEPGQMDDDLAVGR